MLIISTTSCFATNRNQILVYNDQGAEGNSLKQTLSMFSKLASKRYEIKTINAQTLLETDWEAKTALLVIPGGADIPYTQKLNGKGNEKISSYVKNGGNFLGICAGGYYGANNIEFAKGTELEVIGKRELSFYPGKAIGPILANYVYNSHEGARAARLKWHQSNLPIVTVYYNGGGYFSESNKYNNVTVLAQYEDHPKKPAAIVKMKIGNGTAILSGVHFEYAYQHLDEKDKYLHSIIPELKQSNKQRHLLVTQLLKEFNLEARCE